MDVGALDSRARRSARDGRVDAEAQLVRNAQAGSRASFEQLVRLHADRLYAVVLRVVGDRHEAEEVVQETFLRAWRNLGRFEGRSQFFTWLYRIGVNEANRTYERRGARPASRRSKRRRGSGRRAQAPHARAEAHDLRHALEAAIMDLPMDYRMPLVLRDIQGSRLPRRRRHGSRRGGVQEPAASRAPGGPRRGRRARGQEDDA